MSHGIEIRDSQDNVKYSSSSSTWSQIGFFDLNPGESVTKTYSNSGAITDIKLLEFMHNEIPDSQAIFYCSSLTHSKVGSTIYVYATCGNTKMTVFVLGR